MKLQNKKVPLLKVGDCRAFLHRTALLLDEGEPGPVCREQLLQGAGTEEENLLKFLHRRSSRIAREVTP